MKKKQTEKKESNRPFQGTDPNNGYNYNNNRFGLDWKPQPIKLPKPTFKRLK